MELKVRNISDLSFNAVKPSFRSEKVSLLQEKPDTVEISQETKEKNKNGLSKGMKLLLGIGGTGALIYGALVTHRAISRPSLKALQEDFSEIFRREVSQEEVPQILKKYQEILKIDDAEEFCKKAFEQVKKDYNYEKLNINLTLDPTTDVVLAGGWDSSGRQFTIYYKNIIKSFNNKFDKITKAGFLNTFFHEFQHVKQSEYAMRANPQAYFDALISENIINKNTIRNAEAVLKNDELLSMYAKQCNMTKEELIKQLEKELEIVKTKGYKVLPKYVQHVEKDLESCKAKLNELFGGYERFKPGTKEYEQGEAYIRDYANYIAPDFDKDNNEYFKQLIEKEARRAGNNSVKILERLKSIWNIFDNTNYNLSRH